MRLIVLGLLLILAWPVALLGAISLYPEGSASGKPVTAAAWLVLALGILAIVAGVAVRRRARAEPDSE